MRSGPGRGGHPHSAPRRLGDAGYLYHQPAQKYPGHSGLRGNAVYPVRCAAAAARAGMCCMRSQRRGRSLRQGSKHCGTARWATAPRMFWLPPRQLQREHWTLPRWKPCPDARLLEALMQQHGVGIKVANCVALFAYGRMECAPVGCVDPACDRPALRRAEPIPSLWKRRNFAAVDVLFRPFRKGTSQIERIIKKSRE